MISRRKVRFMALVFALLFLLSAASTANSEEKGPKGSQDNGLQQRIDFGNAYILGQSIKSGAVYLLHRKQSDIKGMLEVRQNYRKEIMEDYGLEKTAIVAAQEQTPHSEPAIEAHETAKTVSAERQ